MATSDERTKRFPFEKLAGVAPPGDQLPSQRGLAAITVPKSSDSLRITDERFAQVATRITKLPDRMCAADWHPYMTQIADLGALPISTLQQRSAESTHRRPFEQDPIEGLKRSDPAAESANTSPAQPVPHDSTDRAFRRDPLLWWSLASASSALAASILVLIQINGLDRSNADLARQLAEFSKQPSSSGTIQAVSEHGSRLTTLEAEVERAFHNPIRKDDPRNWLSRLNARLMDLPPDVASQERYSHLMIDVGGLLKSLESSPDGPGNEVEPAVVRERVDRLYAQYLDSGNQSEK